MKVDVNKKEQGRLKSRNLRASRPKGRVAWKVARRLLIWGPTIARIVEWFVGFFDDGGGA
jgi:hypothetical protein